MLTKHRPIVLILCLALTASAAWSRDLWPVHADEGVFYVDDDACPGPGFGTRSVTFTDNVSGTIGPLDVKQNIQVILLGINFRPYANGGPLRW